MRRLLATIIGVGLAAAPAGAVAAPEPQPPAAASMARPQLGVLAIDLTRELRQFYGAAPDRGVLVARVDSGSAAAAAGLQIGDVVVEVDRRAIATPTDVTSALAGHRKGDQVQVVVVRQGATRTLTATLQDPVLRPRDLLRALRSLPLGDWIGLPDAPPQARCEA
jgi:serine protease Do